MWVKILIFKKCCVTRDEPGVSCRVRTGFRPTASVASSPGKMRTATPDSGGETPVFEKNRGGVRAETPRAGARMRPLAVRTHGGGANEPNEEEF